MTYLPRTLESAVGQAAHQFPVVMVTGPRQVGKTTLLRHLCGDDRRYVSLDDPRLRELAERDPALFFQRFPPPILIDEIQYAPQLLPYIKLDVDETQEMGRFWLTGSQQYQVIQGVTESLAGRVALLNLLGFSAREHQQRLVEVEPFLPVPERFEPLAESSGSTTLHHVFQTIWRGSYPALHAGRAIDHELFYSSYLQTYLQRDVRDLAQVGDEAAFVRFLRACAARTGQLLNMTDLARDVDISPKTAKHWLSILESSFVVHLLQPYHTNLTKRLVKTPKLYFLDTGLAAYLTEWTSPDTLANGAMRGAIFETWVVSEVLKSWWHRMRRPALYFYRDRDGKEVDLLFVVDQKLHPVKIKLGATPRSDWVRHFQTLERLGLPVAHGGAICLCEHLLPIDHQTTAIPVGLL